uniref:Uncharacterized protein n=1 Tax=Oryza sativa subsp. japonica TaxID=39947 RepID=Q6K5B4_ORYSJ|nr:hypothetical protein [Oryza sativa Japonica Group]
MVDAWIKKRSNGEHDLRTRCGDRSLALSPQSDRNHLSPTPSTIVMVPAGFTCAAHDDKEQWIY